MRRRVSPRVAVTAGRFAPVVAFLGFGFREVGVTRPAPARFIRLNSSSTGPGYVEEEYGWPVSWRARCYPDFPGARHRPRDWPPWNPAVVASAGLVTYALPVAAVGWWVVGWRRTPVRRTRWAAVAAAVGLGGLAAAGVGCVGGDRVAYRFGPSGPQSGSGRQWFHDGPEVLTRAWRKAGFDDSWETHTRLTVFGMDAAGLIALPVIRPWRRPTPPTDTLGASGPPPSPTFLPPGPGALTLP